MVEQSGEPLLLSFLCCLPHTVQPLGHALPALCRVHVRLSGRTVARNGLRMMPTFPPPPLSFRTAGFPQYGWKAGLSGSAFPHVAQVKQAPGIPCATRKFASALRALRCPALRRSVSEQWTRWRTAIRGVDSSTPEVFAPVWVLLSQPINAYSTSSVPLAGTSRSRRLAVYTGCPRCAGAPRRPASGSVLSLYVPSRHAVLYGHGESIGCTYSVFHR